MLNSFLYKNFKYKKFFGTCMIIYKKKYLGMKFYDVLLQNEKLQERFSLNIILKGEIEQYFKKTK